MRNFTRTDSISISMLLFLLGIVTCGIIGFTAGYPIQRWYPILSLLIAVSFCACTSARQFRFLNCTVFLLCVFGAVAIALVPVMYCVSDAVNCYRVGVAMMVDGWNPLVETEVEQIVKYGSGFNPWHVAYAFKTNFIIGASLCKCLGSSAAGDSVNFLSFVAAFGIVLRWLRRELNFGFCRAFLFASFLTLSPSMIGMSLGGKHDASLYELTLIVVVSCIRVWNCASQKPIITILLCAPLMMGVKATGIVNLIAILIVFLVAGVCKSYRGGRGPVVSWFCSACAALAIAVLLNPSPVITSWIHHGTPFYPARTVDGKEVPQEITQLTNDCDIMNEDAESLNVLTRYLRAYVCETAVDKGMSLWQGKESFNPQWPELFTKPNGFGAGFRVFFVMSLLGLFWIKDRGIQLSVIAVLITTFLVPCKFVGLGHYVQQIYMIPPLVLIGVCLRFRQSCARVAIPIALISYCLSSTLPKFAFLPYLWLCTVQNLQILDAVAADPDALIVSRYYYGQFIWRHDSCLSVQTTYPGEFSESEDSRVSVGPVARRYDYLRKQPMSNDFYDYSFADVGRNQSRRRDGVARFFVKEFLPREWYRVPLRIGQVFQFRAKQIRYAWS